MDLTEAMTFIRDRRQGVLATIRANGRPQLSNIIYVIGDDGNPRVSITDSRAKTANLRRDPRASLYVVSGDHGPYVVIEAAAELSAVAADPHDDTVEQLIAYHRAGNAEEHSNWDEYRAAMVADRRLILSLHPERAYGFLPT